MGEFISSLITIFLMFSIIKKFITWIKTPDDPYRKIRKESELNARVVKKINSRPHIHNRVGALSIFEQEDNSGKLSLIDPDD